MSVRVRFAPSPTGHVHIGNIRVAMFNWLFARHEDGKFLLRIEDTDRERSTPEAIRTLLDVMAWLGLDYDEEPLYQTSRRQAHLDAATSLLDAERAYRSAKGGEGEAVVFRIPWHAEQTVPGVVRVGPVELDVHPDVPVCVNAAGISFAQPSKKGKPMPQAACLTGFRDLRVMGADGKCMFRLEDEIEDVLAGTRSFSLERPAKLAYTRCQVQYHDLVKGTLAKPLDSMRDFVIVRSDGSPVFHLANVCDDITQRVTHIVRGDDHVENTYRHIFLFAALGADPPKYAHLPMIVNAQGKPYSKRDGDAFVGDFRDKGYLADALLNYLTFLGWSPGDDREKLTRDELVSLFSLDRVQNAAAQMDLRKLANLNGRYMAELPTAEFIARCREATAELPWSRNACDVEFTAVAQLMQSRTKLFSDAAGWEHFFAHLPGYDENACHKFLTREGVKPAFERLIAKLAEADDFNAETIERMISETTEAAGIAEGKLNQPLRVAVTGATVGAGIYEVLALLGREKAQRRLRHVLATYCGD